MVSEGNSYHNSINLAWRQFVFSSLCSCENGKGKKWFDEFLFGESARNFKGPMLQNNVFSTERSIYLFCLIPFVGKNRENLFVAYQIRKKECISNENNTSYPFPFLRLKSPFSRSRRRQKVPGHFRREKFRFCTTKKRLKELRLLRDEVRGWIILNYANNRKLPVFSVDYERCSDKAFPRGILSVAEILFYVSLVKLIIFSPALSLFRRA